MRKVYTSSDLNLVQYARSDLESHKIESVILRERLAGAVGGIAPLDARTELWVHDAVRIAEARQLIESAMKITETQQQPWHCPGCGENIEAQFTQCWKCKQSASTNLISKSVILFLFKKHFERGLVVA